MDDSDGRFCVWTLVIDGSGDISSCTIVMDAFVIDACLIDESSDDSNWAIVMGFVIGFFVIDDLWLTISIWRFYFDDASWLLCWTIVIDDCCDWRF